MKDAIDAYKIIANAMMTLHLCETRLAEALNPKAKYTDSAIINAIFESERAVKDLAGELHNKFLTKEKLKKFVFKE